MAGPSDYDGSVALNVETHGKLTDEETMDLKNNKLQRLIRTIDEDIQGDLLDYSFAMVNNGKTMEQVANELLSMGFCSEDKTHALCKILAEHIQKKNGKAEAGESSSGKEAAAAPAASSADGNKRVVSLKVSRERNILVRTQSKFNFHTCVSYFVVVL
jgi:hypothetical protein